VLDYSQVFALEEYMFKDQDHLNGIGGERLLERVRADIDGTDVERGFGRKKVGGRSKELRPGEWLIPRMPDWRSRLGCDQYHAKGMLGSGRVFTGPKRLGVQRPRLDR